MTWLCFCIEIFHATCKQLRLVETNVDRSTWAQPVFDIHSTRNLNHRLDEAIKVPWSSLKYCQLWELTVLSHESEISMLFTSCTCDGNRTVFGCVEMKRWTCAMGTWECQYWVKRFVGKLYGVLMVKSSHFEMKLLVLDEIAIFEFGLFDLLRYLNQYDSLIV